MSDKGRTITLRVTQPGDLRRDVIKAESASILVPEIDLEVTSGVCVCVKGGGGPGGDLWWQHAHHPGQPPTPAPCMPAGRQPGRAHHHRGGTADAPCTLHAGSLGGLITTVEGLLMHPAPCTQAAWVGSSPPWRAC